MSNLTFERHWQTQALVTALLTLRDGDRMSFADLAQLAGVPIDDVRKRRLYRAKLILQRDHHVLIDTISGFGVVRLPQERVTVPVEKRQIRIRGAAHRIVNTVRDGITDFNRLPTEIKTAAWTSRAVAGAVLLATSKRANRTLRGQVEASNGQLKIGRTLELLRKGNLKP